jgi:hypothetical protein
MIVMKEEWSNKEEKVQSGSAKKFCGNQNKQTSSLLSNLFPFLRFVISAGF